MPEQNESERIAVIRERLNKISITPWHVAGGLLIRNGGRNIADIPLSMFDNSQGRHNADFIAHAPEDIEFLLAQLEAALNPVTEGWVTIGTITTDMETETQTFVRSNPVEGKD